MTYQVTITDVAEALYAESPRIKIDLTRIYCQLTGAPIATIGHDSFVDIATVGMFDLSDESDREDFANQCFERLMASCRPSPVWNFVTVNTLDSLRNLRPIETLAYLWNKLAAPIDPNHLKNPRWKYVDIIQHRILSYNAFDMLARAGLLTEELTARAIESLLRIDVFSNLAAVTWQGKLPPELDSTEESIAAWIESLYKFSLGERDAGLRRLELGSVTPANSGNAASRKAYVSMFVEGRRLVRDSQDDSPKPRKASDPAKAKRRTMMANRVHDMLRELTGTARTYSVPKGAPTPKPVASVIAPKQSSTPMTFAAKLAMAKAARESQGES